MTIKDIKKKFLSSKNRRQMERELVNALSYVRNIVILGRGKNISAELLMEELAYSSKALKPAFLDMSHYLHILDKESAAGVLYSYLQTGFSKDLGRFLAGWEDIPSEDLLGTVEIYMDSIRDEQYAGREQREELLSDLIYLPVVANAMLVMLDFLYVAFVLEQQGLFQYFSK